MAEHDSVRKSIPKLMYTCLLYTKALVQNHVRGNESVFKARNRSEEDFGCHFPEVYAQNMSDTLVTVSTFIIR